jgi:hypothetical protein
MNRARATGRATLRDARGNSLIETAIVLPLLLLVTFGIVDFASLFYAYVALENGVSQATRFAITGNQLDDPANPGTPLSREEAIKLTMREATPTLTIPDSSFTFEHLPPGGSTWVAGAGGPGDVEKVSVTYTWSLLTPVIRPFFPNGQITLEVDSAMKDEDRFQ